MPAFNWNDLRFFLALVRTGSAVAAARVLKVDHTTVRRRIASLETDLSVMLFERGEDTHVLTAEGARLLHTAEAVENLIADTQDAIAAREFALTGTVRIGVPDGIGSYFLAPRLAQLITSNPGLKIELVVMSRIFNLSKREADLSIVVNRPSEGRHVTRKLADVTLYLYGSVDYLERSAPISSMTDLRHHSFIGYIEEFDFGSELNTGLPQDEDIYRPRLASTNLVAQAAATVAGGGLCFLPYYMVEREPTLRPVLRDQLSITREVWLMIHADLRDVARVRAVADFLAQEFEHARALLSGAQLRKPPEPDLRSSPRALAGAADSLEDINRTPHATAGKNA
jgi:DNA-binding transcriptional LysR family regulator